MKGTKLCGYFACFGGVLLLAVGIVTPALAVPSSENWTNDVIDIQAKGVTRVAVYNYFGIGSSSPSASFSTDVGLEWGAQLSKKLAMEYGFDVAGSPSMTPFSLNAKFGYREKTLSPNAPAIQIGIFNVGTKRGASNNEADIVDLIVGKSLTSQLRFMVAGYYGNPASLGQGQNTGYMVAADYNIFPKTSKWVLSADYASGMNAIGGGAVGVYYYFTPNISILTGPTWFNDKAINGSVKATVQTYFNF